jgi:hypothetical protein
MPQTTDAGKLTQRAAAVSVLVVALLACSGESSSGPTTTTSLTPNPFAPVASGEPQSSSNVAGVPRGSLEIGQCFNARRFTPGKPIDPADIDLVLCAGPHQHEVYLVVDHPSPKDAPYPGDERLDAYADDRCIAAFEPYVGKPYQQSTLDYAITHPTAESWKNGDRQVACVLHHMDFTLIVGSMRASGT